MTIATTTLSYAAHRYSRWGELSCNHPREAREARPTTTVEQPAKTEAEREGPRRSPLFNAITQALQALVAPDEASPATDATDTTGTAAATDAAADNDELEQAIADFACALMHALREAGRGPHGEGRGRHLGHAHGHHGWDDAAQRLETLAREIAPETTQAKPVDAPTVTATEVPAEHAEAAPTTDMTAGTTTPASTASTATTTAGTPTVSLRLTFELTLPESPWKSAHDGLIESFAEVQRTLGRPKADRDDDESLEERLREMLVALAAKLRTTAINTATLAPAGSLLSVVA